MLYIYVALGGAVGALMRASLGTLMTGVAGKSFPYATLTVNLVGALLMGVAIAVLADMLPKGKELHAFVVVGALGGFTTFSAFTYEAYLLIERGATGTALIYMFASVGFSLVAFFLGMAAGKLWLAGV